MSTSTSTSTSTSATAAPWRSPFLSDLSHLPSPEFVLSTLSPAPAPASNSSRSPVPYVPRARYCIYRGMWGTLPENKHNTAPKNPSVYESDMLTFTTDARMEKVGHLLATGEEEGKGERGTAGTGGGGPIEAVFWIKDVMTQWRLSGCAYVLSMDDLEPSPSPPSSSSLSSASPTAKKVQQHLLSRMRTSPTSSSSPLSTAPDRSDWNWPREISAHFSNLSPLMRGSFKNPAPGTPVSASPPDADKHLSLAQEVKGPLEEDPIARANFRVVVIVVDEVERLEFKDPETARRWRWRFVAVGGEGGREKGEVEDPEWEMEELWP